MPGATPTQGYVYPILGDAPAQLAATWATLAGQLDTKGSGYDADSARVLANAFAKISASNVSDSTNSIGPLFNTVEAARGNITVDLSVFNGLVVGPGLWMVGGSALYAPFSAGNLMEVQPQLQASPTTGTAPIPNLYPFDILLRDPAGLPAGSLQDGLTIGTAFAEVVYMQNTLNTIKLSTTTFVGRTIVYADLWAFQIGDI